MPANKPRVLLADDHLLVAEGLTGLLEPDYEIVAVVEDGPSLIDKATRERPDIVVSDVSMPGMDGIEATRELLKVLPEVKIVMLSMHDEAEWVQGAFDAGASGYVLKRAAITELRLALDEVLQGHHYVTPSLTRHLIRRESAEADEPRVVRVLLVDDQHLVRISIGAFLESFGDVEVVGEAGDGEEAVDKVGELGPDVVLMDLAMPRMDGTEATRRIVAQGGGA